MTNCVVQDVLCPPLITSTSVKDKIDAHSEMVPGLALSWPVATHSKLIVNAGCYIQPALTVHKVSRHHWQLNLFSSLGSNLFTSLWMKMQCLRQRWPFCPYFVSFVTPLILQLHKVYLYHWKALDLSSLALASVWDNVADQGEFAQKNLCKSNSSVQHSRQNGLPISSFCADRHKHNTCTFAHPTM